MVRFKRMEKSGNGIWREMMGQGMFYGPRPTRYEGGGV